jgi:hypothetical protein
MRSAARPLAALIAGQLLAGVLIGLIWLWWAPRTIAFLVPLGRDGANVVIPDESESQIAGDGRFFLLCLVVGVAAGLLAWLLLPRLRGPATLLALAVGAAASSLLAAGVGRLFSSGTPHPAAQTAYHPRLSLHSPVMLVIQSLFAVATYCVLAGLTSDPDFTGADASPVPPPAAPEAGPEIPATV